MKKEERRGVSRVKMTKLKQESQLALGVNLFGSSRLEPHANAFQQVISL